MLTSMIGRNVPRSQLPSGAPPGNMPGSGGIHKMIAQALQTQGAPMAPQGPPSGMQMPQGGMQPPQGVQMPPQGPPPGMQSPTGVMASPRGNRGAMMAQVLRRG